MVESADAALGAIMTALRELGVAQHTIVIYSSDNGGLSAHARGGAPHTHNAPLRSGKGSAYEGGVRVPTVISWPGVTTGGSRCAVPVVSHDFFPTILTAAGLVTPEDYTVDGEDLGPLLRGGDELARRQPLCWHQPHQWGASGPGIEPFTSIREDTWKLIYFHAGGRFELYDLTRDVGETTDLATTRPEIVRDLARRLDAWIVDAGVQLSIDTATEQPIDLPGEVARRE
jgi:arylsulfatase A-like enzyme